jgi:BirA family biotin operon repressor/biotin-[acetyl-CoA-carboxylase] ligase
MLIENDLMGIHISQSIAGVGININQKEFHSSAPNPISIIQITHRESDRMEILAQVLQRIKEYYKILQEGDIEFISSLPQRRHTLL